MEEGLYYIKIIADIPRPDQETVNTLASEAKRHGKLSIAHVTSVGPFKMAQITIVDFARTCHSTAFLVKRL